MTVEQISETPAAQQQLRTYNESSNMVKRLTYPSIPAGIHWCFAGCVLVDAATPAQVDSTLVPAITALPEVTSVLNPRVWGQAPSQILADSNPSSPVDYNLQVLVTATLLGRRGFGADTWSHTEQLVESILPPVGKKWVVLILTLPSALDTAQKITDLETAIEAIAGVTKCEHLLGGTTPADLSSGAFHAEVRMRIDPVPVAEE